MKRLFLLSATLFVLFCISNEVSAQTWGELGKIFNKKDADEWYGPVKESYKMDSNQLIKLLEKTSDYVMFYLKNGKFKVLNGKREELFSNNFSKIEVKEPLAVYSKSKVMELISNSTDVEVLIESRENVLTLTTGNFTMEYSGVCPPLCD